jgi:hypothetical protein
MPGINDILRCIVAPDSVTNFMFRRVEPYGCWSSEFKLDGAGNYSGRVCALKQ